MNTTPDHPDFTALALGEHIHGAPARAVLDALRTSVAARQEAEQLRDTAAKLSLVLKGQPPQRLDNKRRNAIFNVDVAALKERFAAEEREEANAFAEPAPRTAVPQRRRAAWVFPSAAAAAVAAAAFAVLRLLPGNVGTSSSPAQAGVKDSVRPAAELTISTGHSASAPSPRTSRVPGVRNVPGPAIPPSEDLASLPATPPAVEAPAPAEAPVVADQFTAPAPVVNAIPASPPTKPPYRSDMRDYASPPRVPYRGR